jgi:acyl-CoA reductase-like NAD-dependent aldehyde dehydrogenase
MSTDNLIICNPANGETIAELKKDNLETVNAKFQKLKDGQAIWKQMPLKERIAIIQEYHQLLERDIEQLSITLTEEVGKPLQQSRNEINGSRSRIEWMLTHAEQNLSAEVMSESENMKELIRYEPLGIVCNISAWNYPYLVGTNVFIPALLAGNAVFYKPSEYATLTGLHIERLLKEAGVPDNVFQVAIGNGEVGGLLLELPLDGYFFTGSYVTGKKIYEAVAPKMVPCQCELGGKDPLYVTDDVTDIKSVAEGTADGAFYNNGQSCCAVERIYVHEKVYEKYLSAFINEVESWKLGNPKEEGVYIGAISRASQLPFLENQVKDAISKGAFLVTGGERVNGEGNYFKPTVLANVDHRMLVMREESFGPIIGIMKVSNDAEAIALMNDTAYGLTASVYSSNQKRAEGILEQMDSGTGYWNCCDRVSAALPWSGRKHSGFGSSLSHVGIRAFTKPKAYHLRIK